MIKAFKKIAQTLPELQAVINSVADFVRPLEQNPVIDGRLIEGVVISTSTTDIPHKLGRSWVGWVVTSRTSGVVPYETTQTNSASFLSLTAASQITVDIYVF